MVQQLKDTVTELNADKNALSIELGANKHVIDTLESVRDDLVRQIEYLNEHPNEDLLSEINSKNERLNTLETQLFGLEVNLT